MREPEKLGSEIEKPGRAEPRASSPGSIEERRPGFPCAQLGTSRRGASRWRRESGFDWIVIGPAGAPDARLPIAGSRAGAIGVLNLEFATDEDAALAALATLVALGRGRCGVLVDGDVAASRRDPGPALRGSRRRFSSRAPTASSSTDLVASIHGAGLRAFLVATSLEEAEAGEAAGFDAVIAKGDEAGGWVGSESTFILLQQCAARLRTPVWAYGGVGLHTAAACAVAGAAGAVLDSQLLLARETPLPEAARAEIRAMDGSETACLGLELAAGIRVYSRPALAPVGALRQLESELELADGDSAELRRSWRDEVRARVDWQDLDTAAPGRRPGRRVRGGLARRFSTVGGILAGLDAAIVEQMPQRAARQPARGGRCARAVARHALPDRAGADDARERPAAFAAAVAEGGALPFLALALMRGPDVAAAARGDASGCSAIGRGASASSASSRPSCARSSSRPSARIRRRSP